MIFTRKKKVIVLVFVTLTTLYTIFVHSLNTWRVDCKNPRAYAQGELQNQATYDHSQEEENHAPMHGF